jgi:hypothetical protein
MSYEGSIMSGFNQPAPGNRKTATKTITLIFTECIAENLSKMQALQPQVLLF